MRNLEQIVEQIRSFSGADFAFVLTRKGRLVTYRAPREMPEDGRSRLVRAARTILGTDRILEMTLAREELVPYGGAAPVDVYVGVAAEQAIVCVVMATWAEKIRVMPAIRAGLKSIEPLLRRGLPSARRAPDIGPAKGSPWVGERGEGTYGHRGRGGRSGASSLPPPVWTTSTFPPPPPSQDPPSPHVGSAPEIVVGEAPLGRGSLVAVRREMLGAPSAPEIVVTGEAALGRETLALIEGETKPRLSSAPDAIRVELVSIPEAELRAVDGRTTLPWVETPADAKRAADAAWVGQKRAGAKMAVKIEEADDAKPDAASRAIETTPAKG